MNEAVRFLHRRGMIGALSGAFGLLAASSASAQIRQNSVDVRKFGAKGDGKTIDTSAINKAIESLAKNGGGTLYFPAGRYMCYTIRLKSRITLYLDQGAIIEAAPTPIEGMKSGGYDAAEPIDPAIVHFQDFGHSAFANSLIYGEGLSDLAILGPGMIYGKGLSRGIDSDVTDPKADWTPNPGLPLYRSPGVGNKAIALKNCRNVLLRDFKMLQGGWFALLATGVDNLVIDNLTVDTNRDGFDIDCCRNVRVTNCTVNAPWDDAICPKSSMALGYRRDTDNLTISDCSLFGSFQVGSVLDGTFKPFPDGVPVWRHGRIKLGTESNGGFKNITITNCLFEKCRGLALLTVDGANLEDVTVSNLTMRDLTTSPIFLRLGRRLRGPKEIPVGTLKRIMISNISSSNAVQMPSAICGIEGARVEDVFMSNIFLEQKGGANEAMAALKPALEEKKYPEPGMFGPLPACGIFVRQVNNLRLDQVEIALLKPDKRPSVWLEDVDGADLRGLIAPLENGVFQSARVSNVRLPL